MRKLDNLLEEIQEEIASNGEALAERIVRFQEFCTAHGAKVDRIGRISGTRRHSTGESFIAACLLAITPK